MIPAQFVLHGKCPCNPAAFKKSRQHFTALAGKSNGEKPGSKSYKILTMS